MKDLATKPDLMVVMMGLMLAILICNIAVSVYVKESLDDVTITERLIVYKYVYREECIGEI